MALIQYMLFFLASLHALINAHKTEENCPRHTHLLLENTISIHVFLCVQCHLCAAIYIPWIPN